MIEALKLKEIAGQASKQNGCRIYDIYKHRDRLQIFIDRQSKDRDIKLKDCENVFHSLQFLLHSELPHILESHRLEVSSPGVEKQLREKWHFKEAVGKLMKLITISPVNAQNTKTGKIFSSQSFTANLISISKENLNLKKDFVECSIPFSKIKSAKLVFTTTQSLKQKKSESHFKKTQIKKRGV